MWIELKQRETINNTPRQPEFRIDYPRQAALALIASDSAEAVDGPHEGRNGPGYPVNEVPAETSNPSEDEAVKVVSSYENGSEEPASTDEANERETETDDTPDQDEDDDNEPSAASAPVEEIPWTEVNYIGETTAEDIKDEIDGDEISVLYDLQALPKITAERAEHVRELIREIDGTD